MASFSCDEGFLYKETFPQRRKKFTLWELQDKLDARIEVTKQKSGRSKKGKGLEQEDTEVGKTLKRKMRGFGKMKFRLFKKKVAVNPIVNDKVVEVDHIKDSDVSVECGVVAEEQNKAPSVANVGLCIFDISKFDNFLSFYLLSVCRHCHLSLFKNECYFSIY